MPAIGFADISSLRVMSVTASSAWQRCRYAGQVEVSEHRLRCSPVKQCSTAAGNWSRNSRRMARRSLASRSWKTPAVASPWPGPVVAPRLFPAGPWGEVAIEIQPAFAHGAGARVLEQISQEARAVGRPAARVMGMNPAVAKSRCACGSSCWHSCRACSLPSGWCGQQHLAYACVNRPLQHGVLLLGKAWVDPG